MELILNLFVPLAQVDSCSDWERYGRGVDRPFRKYGTLVRVQTRVS